MADLFILPWEDPVAVEGRYRRQSDEGRWWIVLPLTKPLSLNDAPTMTRGGRIARSEAVKGLREDVRALCKAQRVPKCRRVRVTLIYEPAELNRIGRRQNPRRDPLNLVATLKACQDGVVDAGVVPDDTAQYMDSPMPLIDLPNTGSMHGRLTLLIERTGVGFPAAG